MNKLYKNVLKKITPSKKEKMLEKKIFEEIEKKIMKIKGKHLNLEWCGSSARDTHLHNDQDLDLFVMFDRELTEKELEKEGIKIGKIVFKGKKWEKAYSQHPYIRGVYKGFDVEIVPSYKVKSGNDIKSAVDRTPFHNKYIQNGMSIEQRKDTRLLKQFMKGIDAYGADLKNCALPGYAIELLVLHYETFDNAIKEISKWNTGKILLFENSNEKNAEQFKGTPLIIIDPVDNNRNVASALSEEQFQRLVYAAKKFLENPSEKFFFKEKTKKLNKNELKKELEKRELIAIKSVFPKKILPDLFWGQLRRFLKKSETHLGEQDFIVERSNLWSNEKEVVFIFTLREKNLQKIKTISGPQATDEENSKKFLEKKRKIVAGPYIKEGRITIDIERKETESKKILENFLKEMSKQEKESLKIFCKKAKVLDEKEIIKHYKGEFAEYLTRYIKGKEIFE
ncbi:MAG TPA: CCA tRNA nucleotidyltransferase [archaeon]|nr:CCA tRNA nucleotidyltransferase [archaeon]